jgi:hypothetical protein
MQFEDLRCLLQLPKPRAGLSAGCNYATASAIFNIISGVSVCLYNASFNDFSSGKNRGYRFNHLLLDYYPWSSQDFDKNTAVKVLYDSLRNPLAHCLGLYKPNERYRSRIVKNSINKRQIAALENSKTRPRQLLPTVVLSQTGMYSHDVNINALYWGLNRLIEKLLNDKSQLDKMEVFLLQQYTEYDIKGLKRIIEQLRNMDKSVPQYIELSNATKSKLTEMTQVVSRITPAQNENLKKLWNVYNAL